MGRVARRTLRRAEVTKPVPGPITGLGVEEVGSILIARLRKFLNALDQTFWVVPALIVLGGALLAVALVDLDAPGPCPNIADNCTPNPSSDRAVFVGKGK